MNMLYILLMSTLGLRLVHGITEDEKRLFLDQHNAYRRQIAQGKVLKQPEGANIMQLGWNDGLATLAQNWAEKCLIKHDTVEERKHLKFPSVGQNVYGGSNFNESIQSWFNENLQYDYTESTCSAVCGNYTQLVWAETTEIGCGYANCAEKSGIEYFVVCNYGKAGNSGGTAYKKGTSCSQCPIGSICSDSLCVNLLNVENPVVNTDVSVPGDSITSTTPMSFGDEDTTVPTTTICTTTCPCKFSTLNEVEIQMFLDEHNRLRREVAEGKVDNQPPAADMIELTWNEGLAKTAQNWSEYCVVDHDTAKSRNVPEFWWVGQNLYAGQIFTSAMESWFIEHLQYTYSNNACTGVCGHYTQLAWAETGQVGCGYTDCSNSTPYDYLVVCNYGVGGNNGGIMYKSGPACSQCPNDYICNKSLCVKPITPQTTFVTQLNIIHSESKEISSKETTVSKVEGDAISSTTNPISSADVTVQSPLPIATSIASPVSVDNNANENTNTKISVEEKPT